MLSTGGGSAARSATVRSLRARSSHARVRRALSSSSGRIEEPPLALHGRGERRRETALTVELVTGHDDYISRDAQPPERAVRAPLGVVARAGTLIDDHEQVVVTLVARVAAGTGTEEVDA